ncbi:MULTISPECIES: F0F1 ATP synthase subunit B' [Prochlorococcus]|uniref:ATP synthase subunit b' n=1 Tax=Prochlorococcus marinus (strain SARG / CCMP1375 / SS120) TaxID=167539 RepID=ATPF2_PROMA|nr:MULTISPECIES: F0F1 ATP synthase subunit B' [Prochlorococcus]Q7VA60.1 RecName: Full=ATP synthase subunit b'; AltName: Full=ATP synthase F(0) sector subunit b'; AltName: Full=ATPase subunit II; AltName: Full=F-type ATPase subunit b'; Short=F-ATPase subunit b' [Prochlorococcus marinus subsp. marinus str. CCMP1375]AAQ00651.1 ATP synthase chain b' [Prochlorococcus marinus subsp. marinus str. CCMP1375]KGG10854.1 ATP synthase B' chain [Prochlorococcus marinus str. LG]KGG20434.1 ATP synthase B' chai
MTSLLLFGASEGGLFDFDATLPLMAAQVVLLTFILNALFFKPVGRVVEDREDYVLTSRAEAKKKLAEVEKLENDLKNQLKEARKAAQQVISEAEEDSEKLYKEALNLANSEANASREQARREIDSQRDSALKKLKSDSDKLGDLIVERLLAAK